MSVHITRSDNTRSNLNTANTHNTNHNSKHTTMHSNSTNNVML